MVCFAAGHRAIFKNDLNNIDVVFRKLLRSVVAHLLPQTGNDLGIKSCMNGMHGLHNLFQPLVVPHSDVDVQGVSQSRTFASISIWAIGGPWHVILHPWHARIDTAVHQLAFLPWSAVVTMKSWKFAAYIKTLPPRRWLRRCLDWTPPNNRRCGRPPFAWGEKVRAFFRWEQLGNWKETSTETSHRFKSEFVAFITGR